MKPTKHQKFIEELRGTIKPEEPVVNRRKKHDDSSECPVSNDEIMKELEKKFDELFGPVDSDN